VRILQAVSHAEDQTRALAGKLAKSFVPGDVIVLQGQLGSGKTVFVKGLAAALGLDEKLVNSPSYTFVNEYPGEKPLYHLDLYRLKDIAELREIGWDEYMGRNGLMVVEWGEKAKSLLPKRYYLIIFRIVSESEREIDITLVDE